MTGHRTAALSLRSALLIFALTCLASSFIILVPDKSHFVLLLISITLILLGLGALIQQRSQRQWQAVTAALYDIHEAREQVPYSEYDSLTYYYPIVRFGYAYGGRDYTGTMAAREKESIWVPEVNALGDPAPPNARWWLTMQPGQSITVYVNPLRPEEAVMVNSQASGRRSHHRALLIAGLLLAAAWITVNLAV